MKKCFTTFILFVFVFASGAQTIIPVQYASSVIGFSSELGASPGDHSAAKLLGAPDVYPTCGDNVNSWSPLTMNAQREFFILGFASPQQVNTIRIFQTYGPGAVDTVYLRDAISGNWNKIYETTASDLAECPGLSALLLEITIPTTSYNVDAIRVAINSPINANRKEFDAVSIANFSTMDFDWNQYAGSVIAFSSQYNTTNWSAQQATGAFDVYPSCGDLGGTWASASADGQREYLELGFNYPSKANRVSIYQTFNPGAIDTVYLRNASTGIWNIIYTNTALAAVCPQKGLLELNFTTTTYNVDAVRIAVNSPAVNGWNEIDAVSLQTNLPAGAKFTQQSGNWNSTTTWNGGVIPGAGDTVVIANGHNVVLDANASIKSLFISENGSLTSNAGNTLRLGPSGGGKELLQVQGALNLSNGTIEVNGRIDFITGSSFMMNGGDVVVDGNNGTDAGSVPNGYSLLNFQSGMSSFSVTGGMITIRDPQFHASGQAITGNYVFSGTSTVKFGDGVSTTAGGNAYGFGGTSTFPTVQHFILDAATAINNRHFKPGSNFTVMGNATITSGILQPFYEVYINGDLLNNGTITLDGNLRVFNDLTNNGNFTMGTSPGLVNASNNFTNNASGVYNVTTTYTSIGNNIVNNGIMNTYWLYFADNFSGTPNAQTIGGAGTFNMYGIELINTNPNGVTLQVPLEIQFLYWGQGKLFLGNNDLTIRSVAYGLPGSLSYVVTNGSGKLIIKNVSTAPILFPVGTTASYSPVTIGNGSGNDFSVFVRPDLTNAPHNSSIVHREWNIQNITGVSVNADLTFQWNGSDEDPAFNRSLCNVGHYSGGAWHALSPPGPASGTDPYTRTANGVTSFSPFGIGSNGALPVKLKSITATKKGEKVEVRWTTTDELNMMQYVVEKSNDGSRFAELGTIAARNLLTDQLYELTDNSPVKGSNFYRLKEVNRDGTYIYSKIIKIDMARSFTIFVYPNPVRKVIHVQGVEYLSAIQLLDVSGRIIREWRQPFKESLDLGSTLPGLYQLRMVSAKEILTERLIIAN